MQTIQILPVFPERPTNPARTNVRTGDIEINASRWKELSPETREFVLLHEVGHYKKQTFNEVEADRYALKHLSGKKPYSLWNYFNSVREVSYNNPERVSAARRDVLEIAADKGSKKAQLLLNRTANADGSGRTNMVKVVVIIALISIVIWILMKK